MRPEKLSWGDDLDARRSLLSQKRKETNILRRCTLITTSEGEEMVKKTTKEEGEEMIKKTTNEGEEIFKKTIFANPPFESSP